MRPRSIDRMECKNTARPEHAFSFLHEGRQVVEVLQNVQRDNSAYDMCLCERLHAYLSSCTKESKIHA
jgi:hypothetical protein